jgi:hypothetical protein
MSPRVRALLTGLSVHLGIALTATWPTILSPLSRMIGHEDGDVWNHAWGPWWFWQTLGRGELPWHTDWLNAPWGGVLWFIDPIGGLLGAALVPVLGIEGAYNALIIGYVAAASAAAAALARRIGGPGLHAYFASAAVAFGPYLLSEIHNGISEAANLAPSLLALVACGQALDRGRWRDWLLVGLALGLSALGSAYYALATGLLVGLWSALRLLAAPRSLPRQLPKAILGAAIAGGLTLPIERAMRASVYADGALIHRATTQVEKLLIHNATDPRTYLWPGGFQSVELSTWGESFLHSGYLVWTVALLAGVGAWRRRRWGLLVASLVILSIALGPHLFYEGAWVLDAQGRKYALPYRLLQYALPPQAITHSLRLAMPGIAGLAALAAAGLPALTARLGWSVTPPIAAGAVLAAALDMVVLGGAPWPVARTPALVTEAQEWLAAQPVGEVEGRPAAIVLDLPGSVGNTMATSRYLTLQAYHRRPIPYRPDARGVTSALMPAKSFPPFALASEVRPEHRAMMLPATSRMKSFNRQDLARLGVQWIVLHDDLERGEENLDVIADWLTRLYGEPVQTFGAERIWRVEGQGKVDFTEADLQAVLREGDQEILDKKN